MNEDTERQKAVNELKIKKNTSKERKEDLEKKITKIMESHGEQRIYEVQIISSMENNPKVLFSNVNKAKKKKTEMSHSQLERKMKTTPGKYARC